MLTKIEFNLSAPTLWMEKLFGREVEFTIFEIDDARTEFGGV